MPGVCAALTCYRRPPYSVAAHHLLRFIKVVDEWAKQGLVRVWSSPAEPHVGTLDKTSGFKPLSCDVPVYVAQGGMRALAEALASEVRGSVSNSHGEQHQELCATGVQHNLWPGVCMGERCKCLPVIYPHQYVKCCCSLK